MTSAHSGRRRLQVQRQHPQTEFRAQRLNHAIGFMQAACRRLHGIVRQEPITNRSKLEKGRSHEIQIEIPDFADAVCFGVRRGICAG
jgi:hypothetical protein